MPATPTCSCPPASTASGQPCGDAATSSRGARRWGVTARRSPTSTSCCVSPGTRSPAPPSTTTCSLRLVAVARHDDLAARIVLQRLLPGLLAIVRRRRSHRRGEAFEELIGAAWMAIRCCPVERRRRTSPPTSSATPPTGRSRRRRAGGRRPRSPSTRGCSTRRRRRRTSARARSWPPCRCRTVGAGCRRSDLDLVRDLVRVGSPGRARRAAQGHPAHDPQPPRPGRRRSCGWPSMRRDSVGSPGGRFSRKAAMPSWASGVVAAAAITLAAYS